MSRVAYTAETLAERWEVSSATVRNLVRAGALRAFRVGRQIRIKPEAVEEYECLNGGSNSTGGSMPPSEREGDAQSERRSAPPIFKRPSVA